MYLTSLWKHNIYLWSWRFDSDKSCLDTNKCYIYFPFFKKHFTCVWFYGSPLFIVLTLTLSPLIFINVLLQIFIDGCTLRVDTVPVKQWENSSQSFDLWKKKKNSQLNFAKVLLKFILKNHEIRLMFCWKLIIRVYVISFNVHPNQTFSQVL